MTWSDCNYVQINNRPNPRAPGLQSFQSEYFPTSKTFFLHNYKTKLDYSTVQLKFTCGDVCHLCDSTDIKVLSFHDCSSNINKQLAYDAIQSENHGLVSLTEVKIHILL